MDRAGVKSRKLRYSERNVPKVNAAWPLKVFSFSMSDSKTGTSVSAEPDGASAGWT